MLTASPHPPTPTRADAELHGLLLLPPLDACVLPLQRADVRAHALRHHAVDRRLLLLLLPPSAGGSSPSCRAGADEPAAAAAAGPHRAGAQLGDVPLPPVLICGTERVGRA